MAEKPTGTHMQHVRSSRIEHQALRTSSGSLAIFTAIFAPHACRANFAEAARPHPRNKHSKLLAAVIAHHKADRLPRDQRKGGRRRLVNAARLILTQ
jgi:hypothetical protein